MKEEIVKKIKETNQKYLGKLVDQEIPQKLEKQLKDMDWSYLDLIHRKKHERGTFEPLKATEISEIKQRETEFRKAGLDAIRAGKVGAILLAGGQGTRLGFDKAKGMFNIGVNRTLYIFEQLIANLMDVTNEAGTWIPLYIMTSDKNDEQTRAFFEEHNYFGYNKDYVKFFVQEMVPAVDFEGNVLREAEDSLAMSPNGNGGWYKSLLRAGLDQDIRKRGVEWLNVFAVDNVLQRIADPAFIGAVKLAHCVVGSKVIRKASPDERVGVMCLEDGKPSIVEYYELSDEMRDAKLPNGEPAYNFGVTLNYLFHVNELDEIVGRSLPLHVVKKKIAHIDSNGNPVDPDQPNGHKYETLILDMIHMLDGCLVFEVDRKREFAPVKNRTGVDSVDSARELLTLNGVML